MFGRTTTRNEEASARRSWLLHVAELNDEQLFEELHTRRAGLSAEEVEDSREEHGENLMAGAQRTPAWKRLLECFSDPFVLILIVLGIVSYVTDVVLASPDATDPATPALIFGMVAVSVLLRFVQEARGADAAEALVETIETTCCVERVGRGRVEVPLDEVVVGDIIHLAAGDIIPADMRLIATRDLFVGESSLTGESEPAEKHDDPIEGALSPLQVENLTFLGTTVISGTGVGVACAVGQETMLGTISSRMGTANRQTAYNRGIADVSTLLVRLMIAVVPVVFAINALTKGNWLDALLFSLSVAVGLTPEMLPMIVTTCLAKGALDLSRQKVIVKQLDAIQNLGAIDVLCCDKTGTLTQDRIVLERFLDVHGNDDIRVLRHAFLNSHFETGMLNLIDMAIINRAHKETGLDDDGLVEDNFLIDELPFDYERRRVSVVVGDETGHTYMITKGAIEEVLGICSTVEFDGMSRELTPELEQIVLARSNTLADEGMRVLGVARKDNPAGVAKLTTDDERDMTLIGYLAVLDPPKSDAETAIEALAAHGVATKVVTGDALPVAIHVCERIGLEVQGTLEGTEMELLTTEELRERVHTTTVFAKISPEQKAQIVEALQAEGHTVGFMGDGVNDAAAMTAADCGVSVDTGADVAKEAADIILLDKDLMVLERGIEGGRKTFANMNKYVKMTASSNFGNVFSVLIASAFLPFLPMSAVQLLFLNFIYDISCTAMPWDNVDSDTLYKPQAWNAESIYSFMRWIGPVSSIFDILTYLVLFFVVCPAACGGTWSSLDASAQLHFVGIFQAGWLIESMVTQVLAVHMLRTEHKPFVESMAALPLSLLELAGIAVAAVVCFTGLGYVIDLVALPLSYVGWLAAIVAGYAAALLAIRRIYVSRHGSLL